MGTPVFPSATFQQSGKTFGVCAGLPWSFLFGLDPSCRHGPQAEMEPERGEVHHFEAGAVIFGGPGNSDSFSSEDLCLRTWPDPWILQPRLKCKRATAFLCVHSAMTALTALSWGPREKRKGEKVAQTCTAEQRMAVRRAAHRAARKRHESNTNKVKVRLGESSPPLEAISEVLRGWKNAELTGACSFSIWQVLTK